MKDDGSYTGEVSLFKLYITESIIITMIKLRKNIINARHMRNRN